MNHYMYFSMLDDSAASIVKKSQRGPPFVETECKVKGNCKIKTTYSFAPFLFVIFQTGHRARADPYGNKQEEVLRAQESVGCINNRLKLD